MCELFLHSNRDVMHAISLKVLELIQDQWFVHYVDVGHCQGAIVENRSSYVHVQKLIPICVQQDGLVVVLPDVRHRGNVETVFLGALFRILLLGSNWRDDFLNIYN